MSPFSSNKRKVVIPLFSLIFLSGCLTAHGTSGKVAVIPNSGNILYPSPPPTIYGGTLPFAIFAWGSGGPSIDAQEAGKFELVAGQKNMRERVQLIHNVNPDTLVLLYRNTRDVNINSDEWQLFVDNGWLAKDSDGDLLQMNVWRNDYAIQYDNPEVQEWMANWISDHIRVYGFNGCYLDWGAEPVVSTRFWGLVKEGTNMKSRPVKMDGSAFTDQDVLNCHVSFTNRLKQLNPNSIVMGNGMRNGERWNRNREEFDFLWEKGGYDGFHCEFVWWNSGSFRSVSSWELSVQLSTWASSKGIMLTHDARQWRSGDFNVPRKAPEDNLMFAYCSSLMSYSGVTYFIPYQYGQQDHSLIRQLVFSLMQNHLGKPTGAYSNIGNNIYAREFEKATVYVNPSGTQRTVNEIVMEPYTGKIITK